MIGGFPPADGRTLVGALRRWAEEQPEKTAFTFLDRGENESDAMTYAALDRRARIIAGELLRRGLTGQPVVLAYPSCLEQIAVLFGCFYAGVIAVPAPIAPHGRSLARIKLILADANAAALLSLHASDVLEHPALPPEIAGVPCLATDHWRDGGDDVRPAAIEPPDLALLQYTSGSTGNPRAVMLTVANLLQHRQALADALGLGPHDVVVSWLPLHHDMGLIGVVMETVHVGGSCVLMSPLAFLQKPLRWLRAIETYRATISAAPCFAFALCAERAERSQDRFDLSSWRVAICGGETVRSQSLAMFADRFGASGFRRQAFVPAYGLAEATLLATSAPPGCAPVTYCRPQGTDHAIPRQLVCCGTPLRGQEIAVVDPATLQHKEPGMAGEIWLRGPAIAAGYWNRPVETAQTFGGRLAGEPAEAAPWLRTGDLGLLSPDGLVVTGRLKDTLVVRGVNLDPEDIEALAAACDPCLPLGAGAAFALEQHDADVEEVVLAHEVSRASTRQVDVNALAGAVATAVSRDFGLTLHDVVLLRPGALPRTTSGKVQRHVCREWYLADTLARLPPAHHAALGRCRPRHGAGA